MNYKLILDNLKNIFFLIIDQNNNIIYPKDKKKLKISCNIYNNYLKDEQCYYYDNQYYKLDETIYYQDNKKYEILCFQNITEYKEQEQKYKYDNLTTTLNRDTILSKIDNYLKNTNDNFSIIMIDIDDFKSLNDNYGHIAGDLVLKKIGQILNNYLKYCISGRYGGEEFIILIQNSDITKSMNIIEKIRKEISGISINYLNYIINNITISGGIYNVNYKYDKNNKEEIRNRFIDYADKALYKSKNNGKNQITIY